MSPVGRPETLKTGPYAFTEKEAFKLLSSDSTMIVMNKCLSIN